MLGQLDGARRAEAYAHATHYEPVPIADFRTLIACVPAEAIARSTFVDVGAGMGRALLLAGEYPFVQRVGIELSPALIDIARTNVSSAHGFRVRCRDVRLVRADARKRRFPAGELVVFLFNPFDASALDDVLDRIAQRSKPDGEWILYHTPVHADRIEARGYARVCSSAAGTAYSLER